MRAGRTALETLLGTAASQTSDWESRLAAWEAAPLHSWRPWLTTLGAAPNRQKPPPGGRPAPRPSPHHREELLGELKLLE